MQNDKAAWLEQNIKEWLQARCGSLGSSLVADALATDESKPCSSRHVLIERLACERLTGIPTENYRSWQRQQGKDLEPTARAFYEINKGVLVRTVGLIKHPDIPGTHASPYGLVDDDGLVVIKSPRAATHILCHVMASSLPDKYIKQLQWQMAVTGRKWCDFVSYCPDLPVEKQFFVKRLIRDDKTIAMMEKEIISVLSEVEDTINRLKKNNIQ
jgi:putative phage-type endonuclease